MTVIFTSIDQKFYHSIICKKTDKFIVIEQELYEIYPAYKETENYFLLKGVKINKNKTLEENNINNSDIIILNEFN